MKLFIVNPRESAIESNAEDYHSYLLRLWRENGHEGVIWRASLEDVQTGELRGFQDFAALQSFLESLDRSENEKLVVQNTQSDEDAIV